MKSLLILTDFSANGDNAARYGYHLAKALKLNVILCNAVIIPAQIAVAGDIVWPMDGYDSVMDDSDKQLTRLREDFEDENIIGDFQPQVSCINQTGRLDDVVSIVTDSYHPTLIVMGIHNKGIANILADDNSKNMINATKCPLLLVPSGKLFSNLDKIAFATSFEYPDLDCEDIFKIIYMANAFSAQILIAHVHDEKSEVSKADADLIIKISTHTKYPNICYRSIQNEHLITGLDLFCMDEEINLLVMVHRPHNFIDIILKGSQTQKMATHIAIPLLVLPDDKSN